MIISIVILSLFLFRNFFFKSTYLLKSFGELSVDPEIAFTNNKPTFLEFYAEWCEVCKEMAPQVSAFKDEYEKDINFVFLNVDNQKWANYIQKFAVNGIPQVNLFDKKGNLISTFIGKQDEMKIRESIFNLEKEEKPYEEIINTEFSIIQENKKQIEEIMQELHLDIFENLTGQTNREHFEGKVNSILNKTINDTGKIGLSTLDEKNRATNMINSGSKGKATNIAQMVACLGQQNVDGSRIPYGFNDRTLPHYYKYDDSSEARGFVENEDNIREEVVIEKIVLDVEEVGVFAPPRLNVFEDEDHQNLFCSNLIKSYHFLHRFLQELKPQYLFQLDDLLLIYQLSRLNQLP